MEEKVNHSKTHALNIPNLLLITLKTKTMEETKAPKSQFNGCVILLPVLYV